MWKLSCRSWPFLFFRHFKFAFSTLTSLDRSSYTHVFEGRTKLWAKSWSMPPIGAPFVCSYFYSWHMWIFRLLWEPCWLWHRTSQKMSSHLCHSVKTSQVTKIKTNWGDREREKTKKKNRVWGWSRACPPSSPYCCSPPLQPFKRRGKCQVRTVGHAHEKSLRAARLYLDIYWESKNLGLKRQRGRHFIQSSVKAFVRGENAKG